MGPACAGPRGPADGSPAACRQEPPAARGRALSRQQLIDDAWGVATFVTPHVVDNQVTNLRKKIEPDPSAPRYVLSVRGFGYRFDG